MFFGCETLKLKIRRLKLWKPTVLYYIIIYYRMGAHGRQGPAKHNEATNDSNSSDNNNYYYYSRPPRPSSAKLLLY